MAWGQVGSATFDRVNGGTSVAPAKPSGVAQYDIMFTLLQRRNDEALATVPTGWTLIGKGLPLYSSVEYAHWLYYKVAGDSEPASYTWEWTNTEKVAAHVTAFRDGFAPADPIDTYSNTVYDGEGNYIIRGAGVSVAAPGSPVLIIGGHYSTAADSFTGPEGFTEHADQGDTTADWWGFCYSKILGAGPTGDLDVAMSSTAYDSACHAFVVALSPPGLSIPVAMHHYRSMRG